ncbi:MAG TPA: serine/threonine-protein kinase, partial [Kofleriaceae bacterium]|nr:serine/threonine-protein kinase [Kofleriaceae bacterium]
MERRGSGTVSVDGAPAPASTPAAPDRLAPGDVVDGVYRIERLLGAGGHGAVYLALHQGLGGARFALKVVHASSGAAAEALVREGRLAAQIQSAHVVKVSALGRLPGGAPYLVMEYVEGPTLDELVGARALTLAEAIDCGRQLCLALEAAHGQRLVHGDVSLRNVFASAQPDGSLHLQLGDFGLVRRVRSDPATTVSIELDVARGTPRFMAPELIAGGDVDTCGDLFSVGVVLYRLLAGVFPFDGATTREVFTAILRGQPPALSRLRPDAGAVAAVVMRCLELDPAARFDSARELRLALDAARTAPPAA